MIPRASALVAWLLLAVAAARCGSAPLLAVVAFLAVGTVAQSCEAQRTARAAIARCGR